MSTAIDTAQYNDSTGLSWLWALIFGPIWFLWHGFYKWALVVFLLNFVLIGFILAPFLAYKAHSERADERAERERTLRAMEGRGK
jgi:uncharacterized membrane protein